MFLLYVVLKGDDITPIPCSYVVESKLLGEDFLECHGVDDRIKDDLYPTSEVKTLILRKKQIIYMMQILNDEEKPKEEVVEPKVEPKVEIVEEVEPKKEPKKTRKYIKSGKFKKRYKL